MEQEIYQILRKHKLTLKKREEVLADLLLLFNVSGTVCEHNYKPKNATKGVKYVVCTKCGEFNSQTLR
jgi:hypothetical protein